jgi:SpoIID/LytB domain protein
VGLCQVGASGLAQTGATAETILKHYYTGVSIVRAY